MCICYLRYQIGGECRDRKRVLLPFMLRDCNNRLFVLKKKKIELQTDKIDLGENTTTCTDKVKNKKSGENLQTCKFPLSASTSSRQTIPRLELLGALILARIVNKLKSLGIESPTVMWTDSMKTLCWTKNERVWKQYIGQRVDEIRRLTHKDSWRHCPEEINPADLPTRGLTAKELSTCNTRWNGPNFLRNPVNKWPKMSQTAQTEEEEIQRKEIKNEKVITHSMVNHSTMELTR